MKVPVSGGAQPPTQPQVGGGSAAEAGVAAAGGMIGGVADVIFQQMSHEQSMIDKDKASRTSTVGQLTENMSNVTASSLKASADANKDLNKSLL